MSKATRIKQAIRITVISTLVFYFGLIALLNLPAVQHRISTYAARELTRLTQAEVSIGNVDLGLLNRVVIQNVQIKDRQKKDMLGISRFSVKIDIPSLFRGKIRISSVQLFGLDARLNRVHPKAPLNCQFLIDTFASNDTTKSEKSIDLRINSVLIRRGQIHYDVLSESNTPRRFNPHHIGISELSATISLKALQTDSLNAQIRRMSFNEQSGFQLKKFALRPQLPPKGIHLHDLNLSLPATTVNIDTFTVVGELTAPDFISDTQTTYMGRLNASVTPADIACFVPALQHFSGLRTHRHGFSWKRKTGPMHQFLSFQPPQSTGNTRRRHARPQQSFATALFFWRNHTGRCRRDCHFLAHTQPERYRSTSTRHPATTGLSQISR